MLKTRILIVEDNVIVAEDLKVKLERLGYDVTGVAYAGKEAVEKIQERVPDIALMDIRLGDGMNGIDTAAILKNEYHVPVIYLTAHADEDTVSKAKKTEPYGYIVKPFDDQELKTTIEIAVYKLKADRKVRESREWLQTVLMSIGDGVIATDKKNQILFMNPVAEKLTEYKEAEVIGKPIDSIFNIISEDSREPVENPVLKVLESGKIVGLANHTLLITKSGKELPISDSGSPIIDVRGQILGVVLIFRDQIKERAAEKKLRASEQKYRNMMEFLVDPTYLVAEDLTIEYMNPAMIKRVGRDAIGQFCYSAIHQQDQRCEWCIFETEKFLKFGSVETIVKSPLDNRTFRINNMPIVNKDGSVSKMTMFRDITEYINTVKEKEKAQQELIQFQKMESIGNLAGGIAHDFNNLLSSIIGYAELGLMQVNKDKELADDLNEIHIAGLRAKELVKQILIFARQASHHPKSVKPGEIADEVIKLLRSSIPKDIEIILVNASVQSIVADPTQIHQVFMNLSTNAAQAMEKDGGLLHIEVKDIVINKETKPETADGLTPGAYVEIVVSDNGVGMQTDNLAAIFEPYFTTKGVGEGTGLGLAVVHGIVKSCNGRIHVESEPGKGATFKLYFPAAETPNNESVEKKSVMPTGNEKILFVDDEASIEKMGRRFLEQLGYRVITENSSLRALERVKKEPAFFDLVISDVTMPAMTGDKLAAEILKINPDLPIILCTGYSKKISGKVKNKKGIAGILYKPIEQPVLAKKVRDILDK